MKNNIQYLLCFLIGLLISCSDSSLISKDAGPTGSGEGGSLARFTIVGNYLYTVDRSMLRVVDISTKEDPIFLGEFRVGFEVETIYGFDHYLFIGRQTGVNVFDISDPVNPESLASFAHLQSCDPVVTDGKYAYSTLRGGTVCRSEINQLDVFSLDSLDSGWIDHLASYPMTAPSGIGLDGETLFLCDLEEGLKVYDVSDPYNITSQLIAHFEDIEANDVIPIKNRKLLLLIAKNGFFQYDYTDLHNIQLVHSILIDQ